MNDYDELEKFFKKIDKIWHEQFEGGCIEFVPNCFTCKIYLIYNKFKQEVFDEVLR